MKKNIKSSDVMNIVIIVLTLIVAVAMFLPFMWMFATSLRHPSDSWRLPPSFIPTDFVYENYLEVLFSSIPFFRFFGNSLLVATIVTLAQVITCSTAAYAFARLNFPGKKFLFSLLLATVMVPIQVTIIPIFIGISRAGLSNTLPSIILPYVTSVFGVFMLRQFYATLPKELEESGKVDGANPFTIFFRIILPQSGASLAALAILAFNGSWNNYFVPLIFLSDWDKMTLPLGIASLRGIMGSGNLSALMAGVTMGILPVFVVFLFAQRYIIEGIAMSGIKG